MAYAPRQTDTSANLVTSPQQANDVSAPRRADLRGMTFAEGEAALSPDAVQMKPDAASTALGTDKKQPEKKRDAGMPEEITALGLKKVKVLCTPETWAKLSGEEQQGVIVFLQSKEQECLEGRKRVTVTVRSNKLLDVDEETVAGMEQDAAANVASMNGGQAPTKHTEGQSGKTIGVNTTPPETKSVPIDKVTEVPPKGPTSMDATFKAAGSTFDSADYEPEDMQQSGVYELLEQAAAKILEYRAIDPNAKVTVTVVASESHVPNPPQFKEVGSLAAARAANATALAQAHFASLNIDPANITYGVNNLGANGPEWDRALGSHHPLYTEHQFVSLELHAEVMEEDEAGETKVEGETKEETKVEGERVSLSVTSGRGGGGGNSFDKGLKKKKRTRGKGTSTRKWKPFKGVTTAC